MTSLNIRDFNLEKIIGHGGYSDIHAVRYNNKMYVLKAARIKKAKVEGSKVVEKILLLIAKHPFIINMHACFYTPTKLCYVLDYAQGGDLDCLINRTGSLPEQTAAFYAAETASAINFLHMKSIVHRDIKPKNILIASDGHIMLTDFGQGKKLGRAGRTNSFLGTPTFMAPEILRHELYSYEVDWWSLGVTLYIMILGRPPFIVHDLQIFKLYEEIKRKQVTFPRSLSTSAVSILRGFLNKNPYERLRFSDMKCHAFFSKIDWELLEGKKLNPPIIPVFENDNDFRFFGLNTRDPASFSDFYPAVSPDVEYKQCFVGFDYTDPNWNP